MPATIPSHQALVLPLKLRHPRRFDGVALVLGSTMPDAGYITQGFLAVPSHAWHSLVWFSLPLTLAAAVLVRRTVGVIAAHLPAAGPFALRDYGVLATVRHPFAVTALSALLGAASHMLWDSFTHPYVLFGHPFTGDGAHFPALHHPAIAGLPWWRVIHLASEVIGTAVVLSAAVHIGRGRLLVAWHGPAPRTPRRPVLFWSAAAAVFAFLMAFALTLPGNTIASPNVIGMRVIAAAALALPAAAAVVARRAPVGVG